MATFEIYQDKEKEFRFVLKARNGQTILSSEAYRSKAGVLNGIESVRKNSTNNDQYVISSITPLFFSLKAWNNHIIGTSRHYMSESAMENGIESVKINAGSAEIKDMT